MQEGIPKEEQEDMQKEPPNDYDEEQEKEESVSNIATLALVPESKLQIPPLAAVKQLANTLSLALKVMSWLFLRTQKTEQQSAAIGVREKPVVEDLQVMVERERVRVRGRESELLMQKNTPSFRALYTDVTVT